MLDIPRYVYLILGIVVVVLVIGWILIPFILMNTNAYLRRVWREQERTNELLEAMRPSRRVPQTDVPSVHVEPRDK